MTYKFFTLTLILSFIYNLTFCQQRAGKEEFVKWQKESLENIRLLPRYGYRAKNQYQRKADEAFIERIMSLPGYKSKRDESDHQVSLGFQYLRRGDVKTAMYRFNQAYLLDSTNTNDYWGYGSVYMYFGEDELAAKMYERGLKQDSLNANLWTDYATVYIGKYYEGDEQSLDTAVKYLLKSYAVDDSNANTTYKLSVSYWNKQDCKNAMKYYKETLKLNDDIIAEEYKTVLIKNCQ